MSEEIKALKRAIIEAQELNRIKLMKNERRFNRQMNELQNLIDSRSEQLKREATKEGT